MFFVFFAQRSSDTPSPMLVLIMLMITSLMAALILAAAIRIVPEYQRLVVFRLGRFVKVVGPGLVILLPFIDAAARVDLREHTAQQEEPATTQDNHRVTVDWMCSYQVVDPAKAVLNVRNLDAAAQERASSILHSIIGNMTLNDVILRREDIRSGLETRLREVVKAWGVQVRQVEIREIRRN